MSPIAGDSAMLCVALIALLPLALAGLALVNAGLGRSRSAAQSLLGALCIVAVAAAAYYAVGYSLEGFRGGSSYSLVLGSTTWSWIGAQRLFFGGIVWNGSPASYAAVYQLLAVGLAALIPWGAGADRWRLAAACASTVLLAGFLYPIFAHWVWSGGWLVSLGLNFGLGGGFLDPGGAATIQAVGGMTALSVVWIMGPRRTKFSSGDLPRAIPGHHIVYVLFGCLLLLPGWLALNGLGAVLFARLAEPPLALVEANTILCAAGALLGSLLATRIHFGKPDASLCANGWVAGLVASSAISVYATPAEALLVGFVAGAGLPFAVEFLELRCRIDDPSGAIAAHGLSSLWALFALGFLGGFPAGQELAQLVGIVTLIGLILPAAYFLNWLLDKVVPHRTSAEGERLGMDLHELGAGAYPEFVIHGDEFLPR